MYGYTPKLVIEEYDPCYLKNKRQMNKEVELLKTNAGNGRNNPNWITKTSIICCYCRCFWQLSTQQGPIEWTWNNLNPCLDT